MSEQIDEPHLYTYRVPVITELRGPGFSTVGQAMRFLRIYPIISAADDNGSLTIWKYGDGFKCQRDKRWVTQSEKIFSTLKDVRSWIAENLPLIK